MIFQRKLCLCLNLFSREKKETNSMYVCVYLDLCD